MKIILRSASVLGMREVASRVIAAHPFLSITEVARDEIFLRKAHGMLIAALKRP